jgi:hypothetical protein
VCEINAQMRGETWLGERWERYSREYYITRSKPLKSY